MQILHNTRVIHSVYNFGKYYRFPDLMKPCCWHGESLSVLGNIFCYSKLWRTFPYLPNNEDVLYDCAMKNVSNSSFIVFFFLVLYEKNK